jgi:hypothetical protein
LRDGCEGDGGVGGVLGVGTLARSCLRCLLMIEQAIAIAKLARAQGPLEKARPLGRVAAYSQRRTPTERTG